MKYANLRKVAAGCRGIGTICNVTAVLATVPAVVLLGAALVKLGDRWERAQAVVYGGAGVGLAILAVLVWSAGVFQAAFGEALDALADMAESTSLLEQVERNTRGETVAPAETEVTVVATELPTATAASPLLEASPRPEPAARACPHCGATVAIDATRCKHCMKKMA